MKVLKKLKGVGIFLAGIFIGGMIFIDSGEEETAITNETPVAEEVAAEVETPKEEAPKKEKKAEAPKETAPIQIYTDDKVTISFKEVNADGVKLLVENKTNATVTIQADSIAVNGFSSNDIMMSDDISPMSKGYAVARTTELTDAGEPATLSGGLTVIDFDNSFESYSVNITNAKLK